MRLTYVGQAKDLSIKEIKEHLKTESLNKVSIDTLVDELIRKNELLNLYKKSLHKWKSVLDIYFVDENEAYEKAFSICAFCIDTIKKCSFRRHIDISGCKMDCKINKEICGIGGSLLDELSDYFCDENINIIIDTIESEIEKLEGV